MTTTDLSSASPSPADIATRWREQEAAIRVNYGDSGTIPLETMRTMSGMEVFAAIRDGKLPTPPIGRVLDFIAIEFEHGRIVFQGTPKKDHYNPLGSVHGGYAATLLDSCVGCAIHTTLPAGKGFTTLELKINYVRGMTEKTGPVRAEGKIITVGNQVATAEGRLTDSAGKLLAFATTTCLVFPI